MSHQFITTLNQNSDNEDLSSNLSICITNLSVGEYTKHTRYIYDQRQENTHWWLPLLDVTWRLGAIRSWAFPFLS